VTVKIGHPIPTEGMKLADRAALNQRLYDEVRRLMGE
jgi:hypothetical protein